MLKRITYSYSNEEIYLFTVEKKLECQNDSMLKALETSNTLFEQKTIATHEQLAMVWKQHIKLIINNIRLIHYYNGI